MFLNKVVPSFRHVLVLGAFVLELGIRTTAYAENFYCVVDTRDNSAEFASKMFTAPAGQYDENAASFKNWILAHFSAYSPSDINVECYNDGTAANFSLVQPRTCATTL